MDFNSKIDIRRATANLPELNIRQTAVNIPNTIVAPQSNADVIQAFNAMIQPPTALPLQTHLATNYAGADVLNHYNQVNHLPLDFSQDDETSNDGDDFNWVGHYPRIHSADLSSDVEMMDVSSQTSSGSESDWMEEG